MYLVLFMTLTITEKNVLLLILISNNNYFHKHRLFIIKYNYLLSNLYLYCKNIISN